MFIIIIIVMIIMIMIIILMIIMIIIMSMIIMIIIIVIVIITIITIILSTITIMPVSWPGSVAITDRHCRRSFVKTVGPLSASPSDVTTSFMSSTQICM